ncbi:hypothetical protein EAW52_25280 [Pseudomonas sp. LTJR-52]|nr:hypothetical protein EAW52_25280 [Pseudomonas sp. LTJR-52]
MTVLAPAYALLETVAAHTLAAALVSILKKHVLQAHAAHTPIGVLDHRALVKMPNLHTASKLVGQCSHIMQATLRPDLHDVAALDFIYS